MASKPRSQGLIQTFAVLGLIMLLGGCGQREISNVQTTANVSTGSTPNSIYNTVQPFLNCVADNGDGNITAFFGYRNNGFAAARVAISSSGRSDLHDQAYLAQASKRDAQRPVRRTTRAILTERATLLKGDHPFAYAIDSKAEQDVSWSVANQTVTGSARNSLQRCRFPDANQRIAVDVVGWPLMTEHFVFWASLMNFDNQNR